MNSTPDTFFLIGKLLNLKLCVQRLALEKKKLIQGISEMQELGTSRYSRVQDKPNVLYFIDFEKNVKSLHSKNDSFVYAGDYYAIKTMDIKKPNHINSYKFIHFDFMYVSMTSLYLNSY